MEIRRVFLVSISLKRCNFTPELEFEMKNYIIRAIVSAVAFTIFSLLLDLVFRNMHSVREYAVQAVIFGALFGLFSFLDDKGWNSWKKVEDLFKRKKTDK